MVAFSKEVSLTPGFTGRTGIKIEKGEVDFSFELFGQKKQGFWAKLLKVAGAVVGSPAFGALGLPLLTGQVLRFVTGVFETAKPKLVPFMVSNPLPFGILKNSKQFYNLREGLWVTIDIGDAKSLAYLDDYTMDMMSTQFQIMSRKENREFRLCSG